MNHWLARLVMGLALAAAGAGACASPARNADPEAAMRADSRGFIVLAVDNPLQRVPGRAGSGGYAAQPRYGVGSHAASVLAALEREYRLQPVSAWPISALGLHCVVYGIPEGAKRDELVALLAGDARVRLVQPLQDFDVQASQDAEPAYNDPYVGLQRGFAEISAARAHRWSTGAGVPVAIVDTGADLRHADLAGRVVTSRNLVNAAAGAPFESERHGTQVAGVIAAVGNNREGIVGIAPGAALAIYKGCWQTPDSTGRCNSFTLAKALAAVLDSNARVVNLSLGGPTDPLLDALARQLLRQGRVVVAALPPSGRVEGFPAAIPGVIVVGSDGGPGILGAPGVDVLTLAPGGRYDFANGSSIAAAHASGIAALLLALQPQLDGAAVQDLLAASVDRRLQINAEAALGLLLKRSDRPPALPARH